MEEGREQRLLAVANAAMQIYGRRYVVGGAIPNGLIAVDDDAVADLNKALQAALDAGDLKRA